MDVGLLGFNIPFNSGGLAGSEAKVDVADSKSSADDVAPVSDKKDLAPERDSVNFSSSKELALTNKMEKSLEKNLESTLKVLNDVDSEFKSQSFILKSLVGVEG